MGKRYKKNDNCKSWKHIEVANTDTHVYKCQTLANPVALEENDERHCKSKLILSLTN